MLKAISGRTLEELFARATGATAGAAAAAPAAAPATAEAGDGTKDEAGGAGGGADVRSSTTSPTTSDDDEAHAHAHARGSSGSSSSSAGNDAGSSASNKKAMTLEAAMLEIEARFLLNLPEEELASVERLFFQLEQAHWYYEDFLADAYPDELPHFKLEGFTQALFAHSDCLRHLLEQHGDLVKSFNSYKYAVPVYGCVLLSPGMDKLLLVCNWEGTAWGLPRGKINEGESGMDCAARETYEETGYDAAGRLREEDSFTMVQNSKRITMYIVRDVPEDYPFEPRVRKEVSQVKFFPLDAVPARSYNVGHSVAHVRHWLGRLAKQQEGSAKRSRSRGNRSKGGGGSNATPQRRDGSSGRAGSRGKQSQSASRTRSAPGGRPRKEEACDANNGATFGAAADAGWGVDAMFQANEALTGRKFTYDGNPQKFGEYAAATASAKASNTSSGGGRKLPPSTQEERAREHERERGGRVVAARSLEEIERGLAASPVTKPAPAPATTTLAPAVASLLGLGAGAGATAAAPSSSKPVVLSCASLEQQQQQQQPVAQVEEEAAGCAGNPPATEFAFNAQDILAGLDALNF